VAGVFAEVLAREVGPDDDFFDLGGNSLQAIRVAKRLQSVLGRPVEMDALFDAPTPRSLNQQFGLG
jgi:nonribosomal peptide synthetase DhbF